MNSAHVLLIFTTMPFRKKRRKYSTDIKCVSFPDDLKNSVQKVEKDTRLSVVSSVKSWEKCGDSFLDTPIIKNLKSSGKPLSAVRKLSQAPALDPSSGIEHNGEPVNIAWSSSDSEASEDETKEQRLSRVAHQKQQSKTKRCLAPIQSYTRALDLLTNYYDELPVIDTDSDISQSEEVERDSGQQISDCESESYDGTQINITSRPTVVPELEISGYESDVSAGDTMTLSTMDCESLARQTGEGRQRSVSHWVRSVQAMLQTPQKPIGKQSKTPEDSTKKKRKFQSGGLAERLHRLQSRQRSAISFWRHKSDSENSATTVDRPGVLVLEVLEVHEECNMQLVRCEQCVPPGEGHQDDKPPCVERPRLLVLFNKETAAQLSPAPSDIIHIYPPWQSLSVKGFNHSIVLNTHFSQKVYSASKSGITSMPSLSAQKCMPYSLDKVFGLLEECSTTEEHNPKQAVQLGTGESCNVTGHCQSLLEAIEALGQAGFVGQTVEVVVQRVYSVPVPDSCPGSILKHRVPFKSSTAPPAPEKDRTRLCVLVQDSYGMFSTVQLHLMPSTDDLQKYCQMWQGKTCLLRGIKVVQRVTRERHTRLFGLIDSLWPPLVPIKHHGSTASPQSESRVAGPPPSFCYLLSGQESSVEPIKEEPVSPLYFRPTKQTLTDLMESRLKTSRCSFVATVLYRKMQKGNVGQGEVWLVLTDPSLQEEQLKRPLRRTVALCVNASCVLTSSVLKAFDSPNACCMSFRDVVKEHGVFLCVEQSVIELCTGEPQDSDRSKDGTLSKSSGAPRPVRLDPLDFEVTPISLCTVSGVIVGVDESTAYSWPACDHCGSDHLEEMSAQTTQRFHCVSCKSVVDKPEVRVQLEVILCCSSLKDCTVKIMLQKKTILSLLNTATLEGNEFPGYDVENVLGKELGPLNAYVRVITRKPSRWIGLEEISL